MASNSPRRKQLLSEMGLEWVARPAEIDESPWPNEAPDAYVLRLAETKARWVGEQTEGEALILAADTTVADGSEILGKPVDEADAARMLLQLRGRVHQVLTGVAVYCVSDGRMVSDVRITDVPMRAYTDAEMHAYIASGDPLDKAGAYAIQHPEFHPVEALIGCYTNVVGLPLCLAFTLLERMGSLEALPLPPACRKSPPPRCAFTPAMIV